MARDVISTDKAPAAIGPYSQAIKSGGLVFCSGQIGLTPGTSSIVAGGIQTETERALENLKAVLAASGASLEDVVKTTVFLASMDEFTKMNEVYGRYFPSRPPARSTVAAAGLPKGARVEIEAVAAPGASGGRG
jgi:2-iminobutanoate/2-iminopropanoate deaminase